MDQLTKNVLLVAQMVATMQLRDPSSGSPPGSGSPPTASHSSPPANLGLDSAQAQHINGLPGFESSGSSLDASSSLDALDMPRKRCASTLDGDRVVKAMKMEPQDDVTLPMPPPPHMNTTPPFSFSAPSSIPPAMATIAEHPSIPPVPSLPGTRPPSSSGHGMKLMQDMQQTHPTMHFPSRLDFAPQLSHQPTDFSALPSGPASAPAPLAPTAFSSQPTLTNPWPDTRPTVARHAHSLSGAGLPLQVATNLAYTPTAATFHSPTHPTIPSQASVAALPPAQVGRMSRSSSFSQPNPFAFGADPPPPSAGAFEHMQSRPSTSGGPRTRGPSPEVDEDDEDDEEEARGGHYQTGVSARRGSRTSPSAEGGHGNEVPQEYKAEVERIFFEFLNKTCSNRTCMAIH